MEPCNTFRKLRYCTFLHVASRTPHSVGWFPPINCQCFRRRIAQPNPWNSTPRWNDPLVCVLSNPCDRISLRHSSEVFFRHSILFVKNILIALYIKVRISNNTNNGISACIKGTRYKILAEWMWKILWYVYIVLSNNCVIFFNVLLQKENKRRLIIEKIEFSSRDVCEF